MKFSTTTAILAAALGVSAHPSVHGHQHAHRSIAARGNFVMDTKPDAPASPSPSPAPPASTPAAASPSPVAAAEAAQGASPSGGDNKAAFVPFCSGKSKRATAGEIAYKGNTGTAGDYGCNIMQVPSNAASLYDYTLTFSNKAGSDQTCNCWNKIGKDGGINGFFNGNQAMSFNLAVGGTVVVAVDSNTQGGCACGPGSVPLTPFGQFAGTWVEFDFDNTSNGGFSGADASCLVAASTGMDIPALSVCWNGQCSTVNAGGTGTNAYLGGMEALDGVGLNINSPKINLDVTVG